MKRVLLIDDDEEVRDSLALMLQSEGYDVVEASNGREVLERDANRSASVVIADLVTLEHDGVESVQSLRQRWPDAPVIAISGTIPSCEEDDKALDRVLAPVCRLQKPFTIDEFLATVRTVLPACA